MELRKKSLIYILPAVVLPPVLLVLMVVYESSFGALSGFVTVTMGLLPFFFVFEKSRPRPRDLVPVAVMSALAALGRALFAAVPNFKPTSAIVLITGMEFGPYAGFLTGALSALASNMFLGQGPWTPWQMYAWGMIGFAGGLMNRYGVFRRRFVLYGFAFVSGILFGWFMNLQYLIGYVKPLTLQAVAASYAASLPFDTAHGISTVIFLALLQKPWSKKLKRLKVKYGILKERGKDSCM